MNNRPMLFLLCLLVSLAAGAEDKIEYCRYDFASEALPSGFVSYDLDGQPYHFSAKQLGFEDGGAAWLCLREDNVYPYNYFAASHSRCKALSGADLQAVDDWLVMPSVMVRSADAVLTWRSNSICENLETTSTYLVKVSTTGNRPEDFTDLALLTVAKDPINTWTTHTVSLVQYAGQQVYIAFVNQTLTGELLAIDDIAVSGSKGEYTFSTNLSPYVCGQTTFQPTLTLSNIGEKAIEGFSVYYTIVDTSGCDAIPVMQHDVSDVVAPGQSLEVPFNDVLNVAYGDTLRMDVWVEIGGVKSDAVTSRTVFLSFEPRQHIVIEEGTGNWCGWCPKGVYAMEVLREKYGDKVLPICVHTDDVMEVEGYISDNGIRFPLGFPSGQINRKYECEPLAEVHEGRKSIFTTLHGGFETYVLEELACCPMAELTAEAVLDGKKLKIKSTTTFCVPQKNADLRMAYILTEDTWTSPSVAQKNYLAGNTAYETVGDFSSLPSAIANFVFDDVARGAANNAFRGIKGALPSTVEVDVPYEHSVTMTAPPAVGNIRNCSVTAMLIDNTTGYIVNAVRTKVSDPASDGIASQIASKPASSGQAYDLTGRPVRKGYKGLLIQDGKLWVK